VVPRVADKVILPSENDPGTALTLQHVAQPAFTSRAFRASSRGHRLALVDNHDVADTGLLQLVSGKQPGRAGPDDEHRAFLWHSVGREVLGERDVSALPSGAEDGDWTAGWAGCLREVGAFGDRGGLGAPVENNEHAGAPRHAHAQDFRILTDNL
jgi:hypothetical protein